MEDEMLCSMGCVSPGKPGAIWRMAVFLSFRQLRERLGIVIENKAAQGHETAGLQERLAGMADQVV